MINLYLQSLFVMIQRKSRVILKGCYHWSMLTIHTKHCHRAFEIVIHFRNSIFNNWRVTWSHNQGLNIRGVYVTLTSNISERDRMIMLSNYIEFTWIWFQIFDIIWFMYQNDFEHHSLFFVRLRITKLWTMYPYIHVSIFRVYIILSFLIGPYQ